MSGKGSRPRPYSVNQQTFTSNWDRIFGPKEKPKQENDKDTKGDRTLPATDQGNQDASKS